MAVTVTVLKRRVLGNGYETLADVTGPASYTTGGEALTLAQLLQLLPEFGAPVAADWTKVQFFVSERDTAGRQLVLDKANAKMMFFAAGAEVANATNLSAITIRARVLYGQIEP